MEKDNKNLLFVIYLQNRIETCLMEQDIPKADLLSQIKNDFINFYDVDLREITKLEFYE
jgi:hypothetical protein